MALKVNKFSEIPQDAIMLSEKEAVLYQMKIIRNWKTSSDIWIFKYGSAILSTASALSGMYINSYFRRKFHLQSYGRVSSYIPIVFFPAAVSYLLHSEAVLPDLILQKNCPICIQMRAAALQSMMGVAFPTIIAPLGSIAFAIQYGTYNVPNITSDPLKVFRLLKGITKPVGPILFGMFLGHAVLASLCTYLEGNSLLKINKRLEELEIELENSNLLQS